MSDETWVYSDYKHWVRSGEPVNELVEELFISNDDEEISNFTLSNNISRLKNLQSIEIQVDSINSLPESIGNLPNLRTFSVSYGLRVLPNSIGNLQNLVNLYLQDNDLTSLPESIGNLGNLRILDLRNNFNLTEIPRSLLEIPGVQIIIDIDDTNLNNESKQILQEIQSKRKQGKRRMAEVDEDLDTEMEGLSFKRSKGGYKRKTRKHSKRGSKKGSKRGSKKGSKTRKAIKTRKTRK